MIERIRTAEALCDMFDADFDGQWLQHLNRRIYKDTDCGAHISVLGRLPGETEDTWRHNGCTDDLTGFVLVGFQIGSIVEGLEAVVNGKSFVIGEDGVAVSDVEDIIKEIEDEADTLFRMVNDDDGDGDGDGDEDGAGSEATEENERYDDDDDSEESDTADCPMCGAVTGTVAPMGAVAHYNCRDCGWWWYGTQSAPSEQAQEQAPQDVGDAEKSGEDGGSAD